MSESRESSAINWVLMGLVVGLIVALVVGGCATAPAQQSAASDPGDAKTARELAERARLTIEGFDVGPNNATFNDLVKQARGIFIVPQSIRAAFIFGAAGGSGVLLARDEKTGQWNGPAFYTLGRGSFGLQAGAEVSEVVALMMTERGVTRLLSPTVELGGDITVAAGPVGGGLSGASAGLSADIVSYARSKGLYAGLSLEGAVIGTRNDLNQAFYGRPVTPVDVLVRGQARSPEAEPLRVAVARLAGGRLAGR
jgi:lipid-binding SYLF domain-containing protein